MIRVIGRNKIEKEIKKSSSIKEIREELGLSNEQYISLVNGFPVTDDEPVNSNDEIVFFEVFSGG